MSVWVVHVIRMLVCMHAVGSLPSIDRGFRPCMGPSFVSCIHLAVLVLTVHDTHAESGSANARPSNTSSPVWRRDRWTR